MKIRREKGGIIAWHGTDRTDFTSFDVSCAAPYNVGLHFGTRAAALDRLAYLGRARTPSAPCPPAASGRLLKCRLDIRNPFRIDDVFGHSFAMILDTLQREICRATSTQSPLRSEIAALIDEYMSIEDDPQRAPGTDGYEKYCRRLNADIIRIFSALGYVGLVYENELEDAEGKADSYVAFTTAQISIIDRCAA